MTDTVCALCEGCTCISGPVHKGTNHVPKTVSERDSFPFLIWKPDFTLCERKALSNQAFETRKRGVLDRDPRRKPNSEDKVNAKLFRYVIRACAFWKCALKPCMGQSARTAQEEQNITSQCADPVRNWDGLRTHAVQITNPIRKRIAIRNGFRNVIRSFVNRPSVYTCLTCWGKSYGTPILIVAPPPWPLINCAWKREMLLNCS